jgi:Tfp pilus assembly protein PilO
VLVLGWFVGIQPQLAAKALSDVQRYSVATENEATETALVVLKDDYGNIEALRTELAALRESLPAAAEISAFLTQLDAIALSSDTQVNTITIADPVPYTVPATAVVVPEVPADTPAEGADAAEGAEANTEEATEAVVPEVPTGPVAPLVPTDPMITETNFVAIPISLSVGGSYANALNFVDQLQHGKRLFMVTQFASSEADTAAAPDENGGDVKAAPAASGATTTISGYIYALLEK